MYFADCRLIYLHLIDECSRNNNNNNNDNDDNKLESAQRDQTSTEDFCILFLAVDK